MKNPQLLATLAASSLLLTACTASFSVSTTTPPTPQIQTQQPASSGQSASLTVSGSQENQSATQAATQMSKPKLTIADYKQWMLSPEIISENMVDWSTMNRDLTDCYGLMNGNNDGGDLLSTIIADDATRTQLRLKVYTPEYVMALENKIVAFTHKKDNADFYASSVCHLGNGVDIATGGLWPQGQKTITDADKEVTDKENAMKGLPRPPEPKSSLIIVNNNDVLEYNDIQLMNNTATGAETYPCGGTLKGSNILWNCFLGLEGNDKDGVTGSSMEEWTIPLDGGKVTTRKYSDQA